METTAGAYWSWSTPGNKVLILVFGKTGQVATELQRLGGVTALGREDVDLSAPSACAAAIREHSPKAVINAAAYTAVDRAEDEEYLATVINAFMTPWMRRVQEDQRSCPMKRNLSTKRYKKSMIS